MKINRLLRCVLDVRDMVTANTTDFDVVVESGRARAPLSPGLGVSVKRDVIGEPVKVWE